MAAALSAGMRTFVVAAALLVEPGFSTVTMVPVVVFDIVETSTNADLVTWVSVSS